MSSCRDDGGLCSGNPWILNEFHGVFIRRARARERERGRDKAESRIFPSFHDDDDDDSARLLIGSGGNTTWNACLKVPDGGRGGKGFLVNCLIRDVNQRDCRIFEKIFQNIK